MGIRDVTFLKRKIDMKFKLGQGAFGDNGADTVDIKGLRCTVDIAQTGGRSMTNVDLRVFGMTLDQMNKLTQLRKILPTDERFNSVSVFAGDDAGMALCFSGVLGQSWVDAAAQPDVAFTAHAWTGIYDSVKPIDPNSYKGSVAVSLVMGDLASRMTPPRTLKNNGVNTSVDNPYFPGTLLDQIKSIATQARILYYDSGTELSIWPEGKSKDGDPIEISATTGLVGYPTFTDNGIKLTSLFNPNLTFGTKVSVKSELSAASSGTWVVASLNHNLSTEIAGGPWFTVIECGLLNHELPII